MIPYGKQSINQTDIDAVINILKSDWLTQGPTIPLFEKTVAQQVGAQHGVAVNSATSALHLACLALDLGHDDLLWTSPNTFVASANCALYCGASVDFVDIDPRTYNMSYTALQHKLAEAERNGKLPKIVIPVHFAGQSCDMEQIATLAQKYGFKIIEDASHAIGGNYRNNPIGSCHYSDITVFSFHPVKIITTGEGGMAVTNDKMLAEKMQMLRSHGITRDPTKMTQQPAGAWYYEQIALGLNYRITDIQAALGVSQLTRLTQFIARRHEQALIYKQALTKLPLILPFQEPDRKSAFHLYVIQIDPHNAPITRNHLFSKLKEAGIDVNVHYIPVHTQPYYRQLNFAPGQFIEAERYYANALSLPLYFDLHARQQEQVIDLLTKNLA